MSSKKLNFIDIFSGAGGLSTGLSKAGFNEVFACDYDKWSMETMRANHPKTKCLHMPVQKLTKKFLNEVIGDQKINLVAGGPPCQGFSTMGKGDPGDERNSLFKYFVRTVKILNPEFFLFENVTGILSQKNEKTLLKIIKSFRAIGYDVDIKILEAQKYGVPQKRKRAFIVGNRLGLNFNFPKETHHDPFSENKKVYNTLDDILHAIESENRKGNELPNQDLEACLIKKKIDAKRIMASPPGESIRYEKDELKFFSKSLRLGIDWEKTRENRLRERHYYRLNPAAPTPTINTNNHHYYHPYEVRKFTIREFAAMQSFPLNYEFKGPRTQAIKQIGNAVPPKLGEILGRSIKKAIRAHAGTQPELSKKVKISQYIDELRSNAFTY